MWVLLVVAEMRDQLSELNAGIAKLSLECGVEQHEAHYAQVLLRGSTKVSALEFKALQLNMDKRQNVLSKACQPPKSPTNGGLIKSFFQLYLTVVSI